MADTPATGSPTMNGAETLVQTLVGAGVTVCFANPGTSEMHFVGALDRHPGIRCVLCLFEGVVSAAADGYARMTGRPAATLLHLGPGLANAGANLHNAMRARTPIVNIVGDHARGHRHLDAPLTSDIEGLARTWSTFVRTSRNASMVASDAAEAIVRAQEGEGGVATLILPADTAWGPAEAAASVRPVPPRPAPPAARVDTAAAVLRRDGAQSLLLLGGRALTDPAALDAADRIAQATGAELLTETMVSRIEAGAGRVDVKSVPYPVDAAVQRLAGFRTCVTVDAKAPVAFFAYPGKPGTLLPPGCAVHPLSLGHEDATAALGALAAAVDAAGFAPRHAVRADPAPPGTGRLTPEAIGIALANHLPDNAIICDESVTAGRRVLQTMTGAPTHTRLRLSGGAIGIGLPLAIGAAVACPQRKVVVLQADGSGMYTPQALWTYARERLDIAVIVLSNRAYAILRGEFANVGVDTPGEKALGMTSLRDPDLDWTALARGMGVPAALATTIQAFDGLLETAMRTRGPFLIEADIA